MIDKYEDLTPNVYWNEDNDCFRKLRIYDYDSNAFSYDFRDLYNQLKEKDPNVWKNCEDAEHYEKGGYYNEDNEEPLWVYCRHYTSNKAVCEYLCNIIEDEMDGTVCNLKGCFYCDTEVGVEE